jgi:hypothetical protein
LREIYWWRRRYTPKSQKAMQTRGFAPLNADANRPRYSAQEEEGEKGIGRGMAWWRMEVWNTE